MSALKLLSFTSSCLLRTTVRQTQKSITHNQKSFLLPTSTGVSLFNKNYTNLSAPGQHLQSALTFPLNGELKFLPVTAVKPFELTKYHASNKFSTKASTSSDADSKSAKTTEPEVPLIDPRNADDLIFGEASKLTQFQKFKLMYKKYWYVLIPVHVVTSISWIAGFYYLSKSGVDIPSALQYIHLSETIIDKVKNSNMGHYAIAYLCYKVITPIRYAVSLGMTTVSIKRLVFAGYIKPIPTKKEFIQMYEKQKADRAKRKEDEAKASRE
ncbi:protein FAM210A-like [Episyrphus balteatus]|uniref:protein FAM210A-like n=1 Tax=Episyrphus balteatus TaxID=286459 RepID=UPI0024860B3B|nr:protein FAM210A-like [Episyrphus balteatus]